MSAVTVEQLPAQLAAADLRVAPDSGTRWQTRYVSILVALDVAAIFLGLAAGNFLRFGFGSSSVSGVSYDAVVLAATPAWLAFLALGGAYERRTLGIGALEFKRVLISSVRLVGLLALISYALKAQLARGFVAIAFPVGLALLLSLRYGARRWLHARRRAGGWAYRVLVVGDGTHIDGLSRTLHREQHAGYRVVGACVAGFDERSRLACGVPVVGSIATAVEQARALRVDAVAVTASPGVTSQAVRRLAWELEGSGIDMLLAPALTDVAGPRIHITPAAGLPLLHVDEPEFSGVRRAYKEVTDRLTALLLLVLLSPLLATIWLLVRLDSPGPALFRQQRVGVNGRLFGVVKFRSMHLDAEARLDSLRAVNQADGLLFKIREDPRVTRVGRRLRKLSLDELPQLWNVVRGDMSLVGPRPPLPSEVEQYGYDVRRRLLVKPGITGLWQVSGRADLSWEDSVRLDLYYVENWSPALDLMIIWKTFFAVVKGAGAY